MLTGMSAPGQSTKAVAFSKVSDGALAQVQRNVWSAAWGDYDNDGRPDLFLAAEDPGEGELYHNLGGSFERLTSSVIVTDIVRRSSAAWGDWDNDGNLDLYVTTASGNVDLLYRNEGGGHFVKVDNVPHRQAGIGIAGVWSDYDRDGFLDLIVANGSGVAPTTSFVLHGAADHSLSMITTSVVSSLSRYWQSATMSDYDGDGDPDLLLVQLVGPTALFRNDLGNFAATESGGVGGDTPARGATIGAWADFDNDGDLDLVVAGTGFSFTLLYKNDGQGNLTRIEGDPIATQGGESAGAVWSDFNNDGWLDLLLPLRTGNHLMYLGTADGGFVQVNDNSISQEQTGANGVAVADFDGDGDVDVLLCRWPGTGAPMLFRNDTSGNNWLRVRLDGNKSNRSGIGAKVRVLATIGGTSRWQLREIGGFDSAGSQELTGHFGLGDATKVETVRVEWPSGQVQELRDLDARQTLVIQEPTPIPNLVFSRVDAGPLSAMQRSMISAAWGDYDNDGRPDIFVAAEDEGEGELFRNTPDGFERATETPVVSDIARRAGVAWADWDNDGDLDLFVSNLGGTRDFLYRNLGGGVFEAVQGVPSRLKDRETLALSEISMARSP